LKISIITVVWNRASTVGQAVASVRAQSWHDKEHIVMDGGSTDGTLDVLRAHRESLAVLVSEPDGGIYDALNKGMARASGDVIGVMHSDDFYAHEDVLKLVAQAFDDPAVDAVYGDLDYVAKDEPTRTIRRWRSGDYSPIRLAMGWMPPHPTLFVRRRMIEQWGGYDTSFRIAADYDSILRYFHRGSMRAAYVPQVLVKMRVGGESNRSLSKIWRKSREDYRALRGNGVGGIWALVWKNVSKLGQFI
jgi:glycosyltransferase involved in cell wall biosynthesis